MLSFANYVREQQEVTQKGSLTVFDIDGTLFHPKDTHVNVVSPSGRPVRQTTHSNYTTGRDRLEPGHHYDFSHYRDADLFAEAQPIHRMIAKAQAITAGIAQKPKSKVIIVTARQSPYNHEKFMQTLNKHGINTNKIHVEFAGDHPLATGAAKKEHVLHKYLSTGNYSKARLFDDQHDNLAMFKGLTKQYPDIKFDSYHAQPDGRIKTFK